MIRDPVTLYPPYPIWYDMIGYIFIYMSRQNKSPLLEKARVCLCPPRLHADPRSRAHKLSYRNSQYSWLGPSSDHYWGVKLSSDEVGIGEACRWGGLHHRGPPGDQCAHHVRRVSGGSTGRRAYRPDSCHLLHPFLPFGTAPNALSPGFLRVFLPHRLWAFS